MLSRLHGSKASRQPKQTNMSYDDKMATIIMHSVNNVCIVLSPKTKIY